MTGKNGDLMFCTYAQCQDDLHFATGCWRKWTCSKGKFHSSNPDDPNLHKCGAPAGSKTISYIRKADAENEKDWRFVSKRSEEGKKLLQEIQWKKPADLVWVPPTTKLQPRKTQTVPARKRQREPEEKQVLYASLLTSQPVSTDQLSQYKVTGCTTGCRYRRRQIVLSWVRAADCS